MAPLSSPSRWFSWPKAGSLDTVVRRLLRRRQRWPVHLQNQRITSALWYMLSSSQSTRSSAQARLAANFAMSDLPGSIVRISPHELHVDDPKFFNTLYCQEGRWDKYPFAWDAWGAEGPTIHTVDHDQHKARRQPIASFFSKAKVSARQDMIRGHVDKLCHRLKGIAAAGTIVNLGAALTSLPRDIAFDFILGKSYNSLDQEDFDVSIIQVVQGGGALWRVTKHVGYILPLLNSIPLDWAIRISDDKMKSFFEHLKVRIHPPPLFRPSIFSCHIHCTNSTCCRAS